jgi:hypothetical protein
MLKSSRRRINKVWVNLFNYNGENTKKENRRVCNQSELRQRNQHSRESFMKNSNLEQLKDVDNHKRITIQIQILEREESKR